jgi:FKBP-type peptidyl-prolyl cis-trans isomerase (trigger factor)
MTTKNDKTFVLNFTLSLADISSTTEHVLKEIQADFETKGFRKGKAPLDTVRKNIPETKLIEEVLTHLVSEEYQKEVTAQKLHPIIQPQVKVLNPPITFDKEWRLEITGCELPEITLDPKYTTDIKKINASADDANKKLTATMEALVKHSTVEIPEILIKADVENKLSQLVDQTQQAGLTVVQYLKSRNQTLEQYQEILKVQIKNEWITNLAIDNIAKAEKLEVSQKEVDELVAKNQQLAKNLNLVYYLLTQQKVFEFLKKL